MLSFGPVEPSLPDRAQRLPFGARLAAGERAIFLWQQDFGHCANLPKGSSLPRVRSGELFIDEVWYQLRRSGGRKIGTGDQHPADVGSQLHLDECRSFSPSSSFGALIWEVARSVGVEPRALAVRVLLHLPRVASHKGWVTRWQAQRELRSSAERLRRDVRAARSHVPIDGFSLRELAFEEIDSPRALPLLESLHYLRSARRGSLYFALVDPINRLPVSLCSVSPLEWKRVASQISAQFAVPQGGIWDVSRVYSVDSAPPHAISSLLSRVRTHLRRNMSRADLLITTVDANLGFTGGSYRAANWQQWMTVRARPYLYQNCVHVTPRQLRERFGTANLSELQAKYPGRFEQSRVRLLDSMIFCSSVNGETKVVPTQERRRLHR